MRFEGNTDFYEQVWFSDSVIFDKSVTFDKKLTFEKEALHFTGYAMAEHTYEEERADILEASSFKEVRKPLGMFARYEK
jgi:hypothetical protein